MKPTKEKLFYFDAEWVPLAETPSKLSEKYPLLGESLMHQIAKWRRNGTPEEKSESDQYWFDKKAHFFPEFCKIICVSYGFFQKGEFSIKSIYGDDEKAIMTSCAVLFEQVRKANMYLCGYAIKRFDMPWIAKRMMANNVAPPSNLSVYGKKPWEIEVFDLPEVWGQGNMSESFTPFELACSAMGMTSSKDDLSGDKVHEAYLKGEMERIKTYCEKDVLKTKDLAIKFIDLLP